MSRPFIVVSINPNLTCKLVKMDVKQLPSSSEHITLDGLKEAKLGIFVTMDGSPNRLASRVIKLLRSTYGYSDAGDGVCGTAYLYEDEQDMTSERWKEIQMFVKAKVNRGKMENDRLHQLEVEQICEFWRSVGN